MLELKFVDEELRRNDPDLPKWWQGWHFDFKDGVEGYLLPLLAEQRAKHAQRREAERRRDEAWAKRRAAQREMQQRIATGDFAGADLVAAKKKALQQQAQQQGGSGSAQTA